MLQSSSAGPGVQSIGWLDALIFQTKIHFEGWGVKNVKKLQDQAKSKPWCAPWCTFAFWLFFNQLRGA
jgi:hypothetical protein